MMETEPRAIPLSGFLGPPCLSERGSLVFTPQFRRTSSILVQEPVSGFLKLSRFFFFWVSRASLLLACSGPKSQRVWWNTEGATNVDAPCSVVPLPTPCIACPTAPSNAKHFHLYPDGLSGASKDVSKSGKMNRKETR